MIYDNIKLGVQLQNGMIRYFDIDMEVYIEDIYNLLIRFSFKYDKYFIYYRDELIDSGNKLDAASKLEEAMYPKVLK